MRTTFADIHGADHQFFMVNGGVGATPLVVVANLCKLECPVAARTITGRNGLPKELPALPARLTSQEIHLLTQCIIYRYAFAEPITGKVLINAVPGLKFLAEKINRSERQVQRLLERLKLRGLVNVRERPGRPSVIDIAPTIIAVKKFLNWQEEPTADPPETLADVAPASEPDLSWLEPEESGEEALVPDSKYFWDWNTIKDQLASDPNISRAAFTNHLATTEGVDCIDNMLIVECDSGILHRIEGSYKDTATLLVLDLLQYDGVLFRERNSARRVKPREPVLTR